MADHLPVASFDGTTMDGWLVHPATPPPPQGWPVVLWSSPYFGQQYPRGDNPKLYENSVPDSSVPVNLLVAHGYAVAIYNVRGTGGSGGCFGWFSPAEQRDQAFLVEWLASRPWSNGSVGMMGLSYDGATPWEAAVQNPPHLRTIVVAGMISDLYTFSHTPQGATLAQEPPFPAEFTAYDSVAPGVQSLEAGGADYAAAETAIAAGRACPDVVDVLTEDGKGLATDLRSEAFFTPRRLISRFPTVHTSVFITHGLQDLWGSGHQAQEDAAWTTLAQAPKRELKGQWAHEFPNFNDPHPSWALSNWNNTLLSWMDYWLKDDRGRAPGLGRVDYQDGSGGWHHSRSWPPAEAAEQVLYLADQRLSTTATPASAGFISTPAFKDRTSEFGGACQQRGLPAEARQSTLFVSPPVAADTLLAGNPVAYLALQSDQPGGQVDLTLFDVPPSAPCDGSSADNTVRPLSRGVADLRFFKGNLTGRAFPTGVQTPMRIDLTHLAEVIPAGHRLALVASYGQVGDRASQPYQPRLDLFGSADPSRASQLDLPVVQGGWQASAPVITYPPRPFLPAMPANK